jgi:MFS family permease
LLLANTSSFFWIVIVSIILGIFTKGTVAVTNTMVSEASEHHGNFEKAFGVNEFITNIGTTIAPLILGFLSDKFGIVSAFYAMGIAAVIAALPAYLFYRTK